MPYFASSLDYTSLLAQPDLTAFTSALSTMLATDFTKLLSQTSVTLGLPTSVASTEATLTEVPLLSTQPAQTQPEAIQYTRLDLSAYMTCCQHYLSTDDAVDGQTVAAWFQREHGLWFDASLLTLSTLSDDPDRPDRQRLTVTVDPSNYVWVGAVDLFVVATNHLALLAYPGVAKGLIQNDVMAAV